jgi:hypothetical protein
MPFHFRQSCVQLIKSVSVWLHPILISGPVCRWISSSFRIWKLSLFHCSAMFLCIKLTLRSMPSVRIYPSRQIYRASANLHPQFLKDWDQNVTCYNIHWYIIFRENAITINKYVLQDHIQLIPLTRERWRLLIIFMRWRGTFHDPMEKKPFLTTYE